LSGGARWSEENHAAFKAREAKRSAEQRLLLPVVGTANAQDRRIDGPVRVILPWPPTANTATRHTGNGVHYLTAEHKAYRAKVAECVQGMRIPRMVGSLSVRVTFAPPDRRRRDLDNVWKVVGDALQHAGMYDDDGAIDWLLLERTVPLMNGSVCVVVKAAP